MQYRRVEYTIAANGQITERVLEGEGQSCTALTEGVEAKLGKVTSQELLPEYAIETENESGITPIQYTNDV